MPSVLARVSKVVVPLLSPQTAIIEAEPDGRAFPSASDAGGVARRAGEWTLLAETARALCSGLMRRAIRARTRLRSRL